MKTGIYKHTFTVTVLADTPIINLTLADVLNQCDSGDYLGSVSQEPNPTELSVTELEVEALAIGGEAEFFNI